jgi:hypothetical protein
MALPADHPVTHWGADFDGMARRVPDAPRYLAHLFVEPQGRKCRLSGCASRHREFEGFMMIIA